ncbi:hypothetical protein [Actinoplanes sp. G11-F43]|uniref:hypothetical protein n=1 Tax=Actinoplanes sp. G11-F43 TaxID=3424130 RepID=UPI003D32A497
MTGLETVPPEPEVARREPWAGWDGVISGAGIVVSILATVVTAYIELALTTLRTGALTAVLNGDSPFTGSGAAVPVSVPLAIVANLVIAWFAVTTTGKNWAMGPPWALWTLIMLMAAGSRSAEGDYMLSGDNWVALVVILAGSVTFAGYSYKLLLKPPTVSRLSGGVE